MVITINLGFSTGDNKYSQLCIIKGPKYASEHNNSKNSG